MATHVDPVTPVGHLVGHVAHARRPVTLVLHAPPHAQPHAPRTVPHASHVPRPVTLAVTPVVGVIVAILLASVNTQSSSTRQKQRMIFPTADLQWLE